MGVTKLLKLASRGEGSVIASTIGTALGLNSTVTAVFSLFLVPLSEEFGVPRAEVSVVLLIVALTNAVMYPLVGRLADRIGSRLIILSGITLFSASLFTASKIGNVVHLYLVYGLMGMSGSVLGPILFTKIIVGWFDAKRGFFLGFVGGVGNGVGSTLMPVFVFTLLSEGGWRYGYQGLSFLVFVLGLPIVLIFLRDPSSTSLIANDVDQRQSGLTLVEAGKVRTFWIFVSAIALCTGCLISVFTHVVPVLTDIGIQTQDATAVLATFASVTVIAQVIVGGFLDKVGRPLTIAPLFVVAAGGVLIFSTTTSLSLMFLSASLMGVGLGAEFGLLPYGISRYFGLRHYGTISGVMYGIVAITNGCMPVLMDIAYDTWGNYDTWLNLATLGMIFGALLIAGLPKFSPLREDTNHS